MQLVTVNREIKFAFGPGQAEGIDNVTVEVSFVAENPLTKDHSVVTMPAVLQLPNAGWGEADVLKALQARFPDCDIQWYDPPAPIVVPDVPPVE